MKNSLLIIVLLLLATFNIHSQTSYQFSIGANRLNSAFILRNGMDNTISKGYGINFTISKPNNSHRISAHYSSYKTLDMDPVWRNVSAHKMELNFEVVTHFDNIQLLLYPFAGISYNYISGTYTGKNDPDALTRFYSKNSTVTNRWPGLTAGVGLERSIKHIVLFTNYRMHIVKAEDAVRIMDIGLDAGLKYRMDLKFKMHKKNSSKETDSQETEKKKRKQKSIFKQLRMPHKRYEVN
jgi:hypothetical protein